VGEKDGRGKAENDVAGQNSKLQSIEAMNNCTQKAVVDEDIDGCKSNLASSASRFWTFQSLLTNFTPFIRARCASWGLPG
jgi:hypothetical protein